MNFNLFYLIISSAILFRSVVGAINDTDIYIQTPLCFSSSGVTATSITTNCVPASTLIQSSICGEYVNYLIPNDLNQTQALEKAIFYTNFNANRRQNCLFYTRAIYQCLKYFPACAINSTGEAFVQPLCSSVCELARYDDNGFCNDAFSEEYFSTECLNSCYFVTTPSTSSACKLVDSAYLSTVNENDVKTWKIVTGVLLGSLSFILLCSICIKRAARHYYKTKDNEQLGTAASELVHDYKYNIEKGLMKTPNSTKNANASKSENNNQTTATTTNNTPPTVQFARKNSIELTQLPSNQV